MKKSNLEILLKNFSQRNLAKIKMYLYNRHNVDVYGRSPREIADALFDVIPEDEILDEITEICA